MLLLEMVLDTKIWALGVLIAPGASLLQLMLLTAHSADRARKQVCVCVCVCTPVCLSSTNCPPIVLYLTVYICIKLTVRSH